MGVVVTSLAGGVILKVCSHMTKFSPIFTARNEVRQGYIFTGVCDSVHRGGSGPGGVSPNFLGGGLQFFLGGGQWSPNLGGWSPIFRGVSKIFFFPTISSGMHQPPPPETVNARAVRILLECILVYLKISARYSINNGWWTHSARYSAHHH